ncbi:MAG: hypothetical protein AVDCRST_MAG50-2963 [uncultured Acidimicrobiales bacterium]|uniref:Uncharacterized protein n=1 Tax=uncultured Acidimicrobiales bacterium TaxID=310071 RepID=A0A6J4IRU3_9ACTN|nr:MAG: hypothetical protein AVDCRST_MAG50-2963 [uncultured Acidimicrobiales bacterium]
MLVVEDNETTRRMVRLALELEGVTVIDAENLARARTHLRPDLRGIVLDRELPDGDGLSLLPDVAAACPLASIVIHSTLDDGREPHGVRRAEKGDIPAILEGLALPLDVGPGSTPELAMVGLLRSDIDAVAGEWVELCRWDPLLPPDSIPPAAPLVVAAIAEALQRPQPLGWGPDPALQQVTELFAEGVEAVDVAIGQLVCLREALRRRTVGRVPRDEEAETHARVDMVVDRAIWGAARIAAAHLQRQAVTDSLTGLGNRRGFDADFGIELGRAARYDRSLALVLIDSDGLKIVNDREGHPAGDALLRSLAAALTSMAREQDGVYRIGGDEFAILLPETDARGAAALVDRLQRSDPPPFSAGVSSFPEDGATMMALFGRADAALLAAKSLVRPPRSRSERP